MALFNASWTGDALWQGYENSEAMLADWDDDYSDLSDAEIVDAVDDDSDADFEEDLDVELDPALLDVSDGASCDDSDDASAAKGGDEAGSESDSEAGDDSESDSAASASASGVGDAAELGTETRAEHSSGPSTGARVREAMLSHTDGGRTNGTGATANAGCRSSAASACGADSSIATAPQASLIGHDAPAPDVSATDAAGASELSAPAVNSPASAMSAPGSAARGLGAGVAAPARGELEVQLCYSVASRRTGGAHTAVPAAPAPQRLALPPARNAAAALLATPAQSGGTAGCVAIDAQVSAGWQRSAVTPADSRKPEPLTIVLARMVAANSNLSVVFALLMQPGWIEALDQDSAFALRRQESEMHGASVQWRVHQIYQSARRCRRALRGKKASTTVETKDTADSSSDHVAHKATDSTAAAPRPEVKLLAAPATKQVLLLAAGVSIVVGAWHALLTSSASSTTSAQAAISSPAESGGGAEPPVATVTKASEPVPDLDAEYERRVGGGQIVAWLTLLGYQPLSVVASPKTLTQQAVPACKRPDLPQPDALIADNGVAAPDSNSFSAAEEASDSNGVDDESLVATKAPRKRSRGGSTAAASTEDASQSSKAQPQVAGVLHWQPTPEMLRLARYDAPAAALQIKGMLWGQDSTQALQVRSVVLPVS